jgi:hypothetical protein
MMEREISRDEERENIKLQFNALLAEYGVLRSAIFGLRQMQGQLDALALTALGLSIPLILVILERSLDALGSLLFIPILFFAIAFAQLRHERQLALNATYVDINLRSKMNELLSKISMQKVSVLEYEKFLAENYFPPNLFVQWIMTVSRGGISLIVGSGLIVVCLYLQLVLFKLKWGAYETWLLVIDILMLGVNLVVAFPTARIQYNFFKNQAGR